MYKKEKWKHTLGKQINKNLKIFSNANVATCPHTMVESIFELIFISRRIINKNKSTHRVKKTKTNKKRKKENIFISLSRHFSRHLPENNVATIYPFRLGDVSTIRVSFNLIY